MKITGRAFATAHWLSACPPRTPSFPLDDFSERILKQDWREVLAHADTRIPSLLSGDAVDDDVVAAIQANYGTDVSDLPGLPLWEVIRRCAQTAKS